MKTDMETLRKISGAASLMKMVTGVVNNAALLVMLDAHDKVKLHPRYKANYHRCREYYKRALNEWHAYEDRLLYTNTNRFFHLADLSAENRKTFAADCTDEQYFEFWKGLGAYAYGKSRPLVTSLWNKYRLSLVNHNVGDADALAWGMTGMGCLSLATEIYEHTLRRAADEGLPPALVRNIFAAFSLRRVKNAWGKALNETYDQEYHPDDVEQRNISMGLSQLIDTWMSTDVLYDSFITAMPEYREIFRTKGEMMKAICNINEFRNYDEEEERKKKTPPKVGQ